MKPEPVRETIELCGKGRVFEDRQLPSDTHRITFDLIDGKPDCSSIKMEKL